MRVNLEPVVSPSVIHTAVIGVRISSYMTACGFWILPFAVQAPASPHGDDRSRRTEGHTAADRGLLSMSTTYSCKPQAGISYQTGALGPCLSGPEGKALPSPLRRLSHWPLEIGQAHGSPEAVVA